ncbi:MAG TPA: helix-turn-helix transcriptional regulator [Candidatus Thermoplasmatota archaeon]|nr:helix-turn-helix transcriptional regulator [Candidatus Thermoplasmatota archaeon]
MVSTEAERLQTDIAGRLVLAPAPGAEIRRLRERCGFTQERLAELLGIARETLSRIEGDRLKPTLEVVQRLSAIAALSDATREHVAETEALGLPPDGAWLARVAKSLRLSKETADEVALAAMIGYDRKKSSWIRELAGGR